MNNEILFYHLKVTPLPKAVAGLVTKMVESGHRVFVLCKDAAQMNELDTNMWVFARDSFLPHDTINSPTPEVQPVLLGLDLSTNTNNASVAVILNEGDADMALSFKKYVYVFAGNANDATVQAMHSKHEDCKSKGYTSTWWQQSIEGKWVQGTAVSRSLAKLH